MGQALLPGQNLIPDDEWDIKRGRESEEGVDWDDDEYQFGWLDGVSEFWNKVADKI